MELTRDELIELVNKIMEVKGTEEEIDEWLSMVKRNVPHPNVSDLIFWDERELTSIEIVDEALSYKPIIIKDSRSQ